MADFREKPIDAPKAANWVSWDRLIRESPLPWQSARARRRGNAALSWPGVFQTAGRLLDE
jgi:hypothetical protein